MAGKERCLGLDLLLLLWVLACHSLERSLLELLVVDSVYLPVWSYRPRVGNGYSLLLVSGHVSTFVSLEAAHNFDYTILSEHCWALTDTNSHCEDICLLDS